ncbi:MAG: DUF4317 domain-containing protein [Lachnospiraceae bacterium]|jgi:hypothetical protein|nr:DUF4317 domain-containing protein [Lachnospiraceae bacterium]
MNKKEITEVKKQFTPKHCTITRICGCYVDAEKEKRTCFRDAFFSLPEEDAFKYFDIFKKTLSGSIGKNLVTMEFPLSTEAEGGTHEFLMRLRQSQLKEEELLDEFYNRVIGAYDYPENYLILLVHGAYDIPGRANDNTEMFDASDEVYEYLLCSICPVKLSKPGLSYNAQDNCFQNRIRDWIVEMPQVGFLFPAFHDRSTDLHSALYYSANAADLHPDFTELLLGLKTPLPAVSQREVFQTLVEDTLGADCGYETVMTIHEKLSEMIEEHKEDPAPVTLCQGDVKRLFFESGVPKERLEDFEQHYEETAGEDAVLVAANVVNPRRFEVKTPDVVIQVNPERAQLVETRMIEGRRCLVIAVDENVQLNGVNLRSLE